MSVGRQLSWGMRLAQLVVIPIAFPGWVIEYVFRRLSRSQWEFKLFWSGSVYILVVFITGLALVLSDNAVLRSVGFYVSLALEVLALVIAAVVPIGARAGYLSQLHNLARRRRQTERSLTSTISVNTIYATVLCYGYTIYFFGSASYLVSTGGLGIFTNAPTSIGLGALLNFVYSSFVWMITLAFAEIVPLSAVAKIVCASAFAMGLLFNILIFSLFVSRLSELRKT